MKREATLEQDSKEGLALQVAERTGIAIEKVRGASELFREGATIPFVARYRKERTGGLDEIELRAVADQIAYLEELAARKRTILESIETQGKLDPALRSKLLAVMDRRELEDLYLPFKPKRRTRAMAARERGLAPLAAWLGAETDDGRDRRAVLAAFVDPALEVPDAETALRGALDILAEEWAEKPEHRAWLRAELERGLVRSKVRKDWKEKPGKFEMYYDFREPIAAIPSHRFLAIRRGENEGVLSLGIEVEEKSVLDRLSGRILRNPRFAFAKELRETVEDTYTRLLFPSIETEVLLAAKERSDEEAIGVFSKNLRDLLLAPPAGARAVLGVDPGFRTGAKLAVVDATGKFLENATIYPTPPSARIEEATRVVTALFAKHAIGLIAIGNGTASRETDAFFTALLRDRKLAIEKLVVNESGASIYSASEEARVEFPELDVTVRGAISIARRLQDPLAELIKIDPKSIGVGQYQHDVNQARLKVSLDREVESCVHRVGVDLNTASAKLLSYVSGIGPRLAEGIVRHRDQAGAFQRRKDILLVSRFGEKAYELSAGFLRIRGGSEPLDASAVHPESYPLVERMAASAGVPATKLIGDSTLLSRLEARRFVDDRFGLPTIEDIIAELEKPGRDPRSAFRAVRFAEGVAEISDLEPGMILEGVVTNVTRFGAFVDIGVHQDGLIHISELDRKFVRDPAEVVAVGDIVKVKVLSSDPERKRIALSRRQAGA